METRLSKSKTLPGGGPTFSSIETFTGGFLPTKKQIIQRILYENKFRKWMAATKVAKELVELWIHCNVYPLSEYVVAKKVHDLTSNFCKLLYYDKSRLNSSGFLCKKVKFMEDMNVLFDIYCKNSEQRFKLEKKYLLKMAPVDYQFYEDQKGPRKRKCLDIVDPMTKQDELFQKRYQLVTSNVQTDVAGPS